MRKMFKEFWIDLRGMKHYLIAATAVFVIGIYLGVTSTETLQHFIEQKIQGVSELAERLNEQKNPQLWFFAYIFLNNSIQTILMIFFGVFLALYPLFALVLNGMMLGYVYDQTVETTDHGLLILLKGIVPHGIIEIPAFLLAAAYGIRLGALMTKLLFRFSLKLVLNRPLPTGELTHFFKMTLPLMMTLVCALFVAAVIESTLTMWLLK